MQGPTSSQSNPEDTAAPTMSLAEWCRSIGLEIDPPEVGVWRSTAGISPREAEMPPAHRQGEGSYGYSSGMGSTEPYYQPTGYHGGSNNIFEQALYQPTKPAHPQPTNTNTNTNTNTRTRTRTRAQQQKQKQKQVCPGHARFQNPSKVHKPHLRSGRSVPPCLSDARWNIWTLGNLKIRHINGGVTVKHMQQVLFNIDGNKRTKYDYHGLVRLVADQRTAAMGEAPEGWNAEQGWWVHFNV